MNGEEVKSLVVFYHTVPQSQIDTKSNLGTKYCRGNGQISAKPQIVLLSVRFCSFPCFMFRKKH